MEMGKIKIDKIKMCSICMYHDISSFPLMYVICLKHSFASNYVCLFSDKST